MNGNCTYIEDVEDEIAAFHGAEAAMIVASGFDANVAIFTAIPRPRDAIIYDELVHASTYDGMAQSLTQCRVQFRHNDVDALRDAIAGILDSQPQVANGSRSILIAVESVYSIDGDVCPLLEMLEVADEMCPKGNTAFIVDEAHATGILGPRGAGLVSQLGVEKRVAIRLHTCGKALAATGDKHPTQACHEAEAALDSNLNSHHPGKRFGAKHNPEFRPLCHLFNGAIISHCCRHPSWISATLGRDKSKVHQDNVQNLVKHFFKTIQSNPHWIMAREQGILEIPVLEQWEDRDFHAHIVPLRSRQRYVWWLVFQLQLSGISAFPVDYPTVPRGQSRIRLMFHAANTEAEVEFLAKTICDWAAEIIEIEQSPEHRDSRLPKAAQQVYALMAA